MITTVTLSPSIDKTVVLENFSPDRLNRAESVRLDPGGKGVNVSLALSALEIRSRAVGLIFEHGDTITNALKQKNVEADFVSCPGVIRTNTKIYVRSTRKTVEINEQNPTVPQKCLQKFLENLQKLAHERPDGAIFVLAGSVPSGVPDDIYRTIISIIKSEHPRARIILDAEGEPLVKGILGAPYMIKPNIEELERTFNCRIETDYDIILRSREIISGCGVGLVLVSKGDQGAVAVTKNDAVVLPAVKITAKSAQGAGDAMVAGACFALSKSLGPADVLLFGICASAGAVEREGTDFCTRERFEELMMLSREK